MQIKSKAQVIFGSPVSEQEIEFIEDNSDKFPEIHIYNDLDDTKILGFMVANCDSYYSFSASQKMSFLSPEKEQEISDIFKQLLQKEASYFLISVCS